MKKFKTFIMSAMCCGLITMTACGGGGSNSGASSDAPLGDVPGIFTDIAAKKKALIEELRSEEDVESYQKKLKDFDEYVAESVTHVSGDLFPNGHQDVIPKRCDILQLLIVFLMTVWGYCQILLISGSRRNRRYCCHSRRCSCSRLHIHHRSRCIRHRSDG